MPPAEQWKIDVQAVHKELSPNALEPGAERAITLSHPAYPYEGSWLASELDPAAGKFVPGIVGRYLQDVKGKLGLPKDLLLDPYHFRPRPNGVQLTWLPISEPSSSTASATDPRHSFWFRRYDPNSPGRLLERTAVFLAVHSYTPNDPKTALASRLGMRITAHVDARRTGPWPVRITGVSCSEAFASSLDAHPGFSTRAAFIVGIFTSGRFKTLLRGAAGLELDYDLWIDGLRVLRDSPQEASYIVYANAPRPSGIPSAPAYALTATVKIRTASPRLVIESIERSPLVTHAAVQTPLFPQDPASQAGPAGIVGARPNRAPDRLQPFCKATNLPGLTQAGGLTALFDSIDHSQVMVTESERVDPNPNLTGAKTVRLADSKHPRTNAFAALSAYRQLRISLFDRMRTYGLSPIEYFRAAAMPLLAGYRSTITRGPGKDGKTVNAQVELDPCSCDITATPTTPASLRVKFALADLKRSSSEREPFGLASDPRWCWHEFGHVLLAGSTGALEFHFAHSAGDALAAIVADPKSKLTVKTRLRGMTFPWVYLNRRHDRSVWHGWSWCGRYHRQAWFPTNGNNCRHKGYDSEQILSSSLFRAYLALGGNTMLASGSPDEPSRQDASDYTVYLIMRAIGQLGSASMAPIETPAQFVDSLAAADAGTSSSAPGKRVGGCAHKVVRWAFEAQGLNASPDWNLVLDQPGEPPAVDLFIDDRRPNSEGAFPRGGYVPVSFDWHAWPNPSPWHASSTAIQVTPNKVRVEVNNRGRLPATGVVVRVWWRKWNGAGAAPKWNAPGWKLLGTSGPQNVPDRAGALPVPIDVLGTFPTNPGHYLVLAEVSGESDPANTDTVAALACSSSKTPLIDLVAGDNNLGLVVHNV